MAEKHKSTALVRAAAGGDREAFAALVDEYRQTMYATAMAVAKNEDDALDAIQDTILILWEKLDRLRDPGAFRTWMTRVLVNRCCEQLRDRRRTVPQEFVEETGESPDLDVSLDVGRALERLGKDDRLVLQLFYFEDMPVREIASALGLSPQAVRMRLSRGRKRFKEQYGKEEQHEKA